MKNLEGTIKFFFKKRFKIHIVSQKDRFIWELKLRMLAVGRFTTLIGSFKINFLNIVWLLMRIFSPFWFLFIFYILVAISIQHWILNLTFWLYYDFFNFIVFSNLRPENDLNKQDNLTRVAAQ